MSKVDHRYAVIMAGGSGTRLWPMSRRNSPKQFQALFDSQKTMVQLVYELLRKKFPPERICVQTDKRFNRYVEQQLPEIPTENIFLEPMARDTAPAFGYAAAALLSRDKDAIVGIFYSDHIIGGESDFLDAVDTAYSTAEDYPEFITMIGVKPTRPHTELGYIKIDKQAASYPHGEAFYVENFIEKPDFVTAEKFVKSWEYFWNTGLKIGRASNFFSLIEDLDSDMAIKLQKIAELMHDPANDNEIAELYSGLQKISFEYLVTEHDDKLLVIPSDMEWSDIGDWKTLHSSLTLLNDHDTITKGNLVSIDTRDSLIYGGERLIATLGVDNLIIVDTGDALLIADKDKVNNIKSLIDAMRDQHKHTYL